MKKYKVTFKGARDQFGNIGDVKFRPGQTHELDKLPEGFGPSENWAIKEIDDGVSSKAKTVKIDKPVVEKPVKKRKGKKTKNKGPFHRDNLEHEEPSIEDELDSLKDKGLLTDKQADELLKDEKGKSENK